ncbi:nuclear pore complex protein Nup50 [Topomyia yanbarensis]|uniref:nuclear pore complex protein Nup50 n=1 Tax=Topomyia yanbarensis TaxID=2498891 RepID=UPI00273C4061|nr:nuclear pore complex protein Nup50 [Topomyia yanbarensis]
MAKRGAQSDLNHDNWHEEDESEDAGKFTQAPEEELKKRVIKTARRRVAGESAGTSDSSSVFSGFKGFSAVTSTPATTVKPGAGAAASPFSFLTSLAASSKPANGSAAPSVATGGSIGSATTSALGASISATTDPSKKIFAGFGSPPKVDMISEKKQDTTSGSADYAASIKALNQSVAAWISNKVKENPLCKLTPIFKDYEKYLGELESKNKSEATESGKSSTVATSGGFSFGSVAPAASVPKPQETTTKPFSFGFGSSSTTAAPSATSFTFANVAKPIVSKSETDKTEEDAEEEDNPPKVEFTPVEEKDSLYSKRCKLFVKADGKYSDRGVGTLHIKKVDSKVQVLVRADTNLGNILLNIVLNEAIPLQRMGKNNVMMVCLPTPESKPPPTSVLLRVKTEEDADELYETLNKHKPK